MVAWWLYTTPAGDVDEPRSWAEVVGMVVDLMSVYPDGGCYVPEVSVLNKESHFGMSALSEQALAKDLYRGVDERPLVWQRSEVPEHMRWC